MLGAPTWVLSSARAAPFLRPISGWLLGKKSYWEDGQELARDTQGVVVSPGGVQDVALRDVICGGGVGLKDLRGLPVLMESYIHSEPAQSAGSPPPTTSPTSSGSQMEMRSSSSSKASRHGQGECTAPWALQRSSSAHSCCLNPAGKSGANSSPGTTAAALLALTAFTCMSCPVGEQHCGTAGSA